MVQSRGDTESDDDAACLARHQAYLTWVWCTDPLRAEILSELLLATYRYADIHAGDQLVALDQALYHANTPTA